MLQSAYRQGNRTETALAMNCQHVEQFVLLDLSAAFNTVEHSFLLSRLSKSFGIRGTALEWLTSYSSNRLQRVSRILMATVPTLSS